MPHLSAKCHWLVLFAALSAMAAGCGRSDGPEQFPLSGTVSYEGKLIPAGWMVFAPQNGPGASADIVDGKFATPEGYGTVGGPHTIEIVAMSGIEISDPDNEGVDSSAGSKIFTCRIVRDIPKETTKLDIRLTPEEVGVPPGKVDF